MLTIDQPLKVKQANERYILSVDQEIEGYLTKLKQRAQEAEKIVNASNYEYFSKDTTYARYAYRLYEIDKWIRAVCLTKMKSFYLYFTFGKYKGRIVQDILNEDKSYCEWFVHQVRGNDFNTLKILDYLSKCLYYGEQTAILGLPGGINIKFYRYWLVNPEEIFELVISEIPKIMKKEAKEDKDYILGEIFPYKEIRHNSYSNSDFDCGGMTPWEEQMCDVIDYGDLC